MPKMKTHKGAAKRFTFTGNGIAMRASGRRGHFRRRKALRLLQQLDKSQPVHRASRKMIRRSLPYGSKLSR